MAIPIVIEGESSLTCRLYGIDAPEKKQPYGPEAKDYLNLKRPHASEYIDAERGEK